ncbi:MAG: BPSS1780 family membrane protein [Aquabacterium sp.]|nr:BPSS1780 family membrane protein [Aquabacterium sp.]
MNLKLVKASQGLVWVRQGVLACRKQPLGFIGLLGLVGTVALLLLSLPEQMGALFVGVMPLVWMGFMLATRRALAGERITPAVMIEAIKQPDSPRLAFAQLGGAYILATLLVMQIAQWLGPDPEALDTIRKAAKDAAELITNPLVQQDMLWRAALTIPVSLIFWHTPALVLWARMPVGKALFFSAYATWRNLGAFIVYGASWLGILIVAGLLDRLLMLLIPIPAAADVIAVIAGMWLAGAFYASLYFTVVACFDAPPKSAGTDAAA